MTFTCPKDPNHRSSDPEYCSECGARIAASKGKGSQSNGGAPIQTSVEKVTNSLSESCPDCGTIRAGKATFCEVCRFNFESQKSYGGTGNPSPLTSMPLAGSVVAPASTSVNNVPFTTDSNPPLDQSVSIPSPVSTHWDAVISVDQSLNVEPDPQFPCPVNEADRLFPLDFTENLVGRRSQSRGTYPEIPLTDPGVSHRHAKIFVEGEEVYIRELGSTNGTKLNGTALVPGVKTPLHTGDQVTLGCWTRLIIKAR